MKTPIRMFIASMLLLTLILGMTSCKLSDVTSTLQNVVSVTTIAVPIIAVAANVPPATVDLVVGYLGAISEATSQASTILSADLTDAQKSVQITGAFAKIVAPKLPPGTPQNIVNAVGAVADAVSKFLTNLTPVSGTLKAGAPTKSLVKNSDKAALTEIKTKAEANISKLKMIKK